MPLTQNGPNALANIGTYNDVTGSQMNLTISTYARLYEVRGDTIINQITDPKELKKIQSVIHMPRAQASRKDYQTRKKSGPCFEGTRVALLREMIDWVIIPGESRMYALSGLAGIGKSTVAYTVAAQADYRGLLGASFFFSRDEVDRRTAKRFFTTIAYQLCLYSEEFAQVIGETLVTESGSIATTATPQEQLESLILKPLQGTAASNGRPILVVVDALDECDVEDAPSVLMGLRRIVQDLPSFKIILTTRPQPLVSNDFVTLHGHKIFHLQDIEDKVVNDDIRLYLQHSLSLEQVKEHLQDPTEQWYASDTEIEFLVHAAGKLFIIASTAVLFILDKAAADPEGRMAKLLSAFERDRTPFKVLNNFYSVILRNAVPEDCDDDIVERYQSVVGTIMVIQTPLPMATLARLIGRREREISGALRNLQSVILVGSDDIPVIYHESFPDFITDSTRCKDINLVIDPKKRHTWIAIHCFRIMNGSLRHNFLDLDGPARFMDNEEGLAYQGISDGQLREKISLELRYACVYWADHLLGASTEDTTVMQGLELFADVHMLHWFEVLSLIGKLDSAHRSIRVTLRHMKSTSSELSQLLSDGLRFISKFYEVIRRSSLHTYYSALPFTPTGSLLYRRYNKEAIHRISQVIVGSDKWGALIAKCPDKSQGEVAFSVDSTMFASWNPAGAMKIWDAATGTPISTNLPTYECFAITNDFSTVASAKNSTITLYSIKSGAPVATFTTSGDVRDIALASDPSRVAARLSDGTVCLWDTERSKLVTYFGGSDTRSGVFTFSPTGARLAYVPYDNRRSIQLWDGSTGVLITTLCRPPGMYRQLVFSHDGSRFVVLTTECVRLWKCESGEPVPVSIDVFAYKTSLAISANGSLLSTWDGKKVQLWSAKSGNTMIPIEGLDNRSWDPSLAFSLSDILAIGTVKNVILYDVRSCSIISTLPISLPTFLVFSPDCTRLAVRAFVDDTHLFDVQSIKESKIPSKEQAKHIGDLIFSNDCTRLVCLFEDNSIELWDIGPTNRRIPIYDGGSQHKTVSIGFSPDGRQFAAGPINGGIELWSSEGGISMGSYECPTTPHRLFVGRGVALSNRMLAAAVSGDAIALWDLQTRDLIGTIKQPGSTHLSFSNNGSLLASQNVRESYDDDDDVYIFSVAVLDVVERSTITTFDCPFAFEMAFLPDDSELVVQLGSGYFRLFDLATNKIRHEPIFTHLVQLRNLPLWKGTPVWMARSLPVPTSPNSEHRQDLLVGLFSQHDDPVPVLRIPTDVRIKTWAQGSSLIALGCNDGQVIFVRLAAE